MKRKLFAALLCLLLTTLAGCGCEHQWTQASCTAPKTCSLCGDTEGAPIGHSWLAASCTAPKTCENCGETSGDALGHDWADANCQSAKKCARCHVTEGSPTDHSWASATTELPKTCTACGATEGKRIVTDKRFTTAATQQLHGKWKTEMTVHGEDAQMQKYFDEITYTMFYEFCNDGRLILSVELHDQFAFWDAVKAMYKDTFASLLGEELSQEELNSALKAQYGMDLDHLLDQIISEIDLEEMLGTGVDYVYYVEDGQFYYALSWLNSFKSSAYTLEDGVLTIDAFQAEENPDPVQLTRVE